jgi:hypothetical protein
MLAYCGLTCDSCPIYLATLEEDDEVRDSMHTSIANLCYENYGIRLKPEEIRECDGCKSGTGRLFNWCRNCDIRNCAVSKGEESCALCPDYGCDKLQKIFHDDINARIRLNKMRQIHQV